MLYIDLETRSRTDLKKLGVYKYVECPDFSILMAAWAHHDDEVQVAVGHDEIRRIPGLLSSTVMKVAHNAQFERLCLGAAISTELADPAQWQDTQALAAEHGYPVSLEALSAALGCTPKDAVGKRLIELFCKPKKDGSWADPEDHYVDWLDFITYCAQDVDTLREVYRALPGWPSRTEQLVWIADQRINDRGMAIDLELCRIAAQEVDANKTTNKAAFTELTGVDNPGSVQQVQAWAADVGLDLPNCQAATIEALLADPELDPVHRQAMELRQELALAAGGKFGAALDVVSPDSRIRGGFRFFGAHTGRWTGQRVQPQNLPRATIDNPEAAILDLKMGLGATPHELKALVRSMFVGPLVVVDYSSIEARVLAWMANETWALEAFREGRDIYVETAERMSTPGNQLSRSQGKVAVLALGYNGAVNSLRAMGAQGTDPELAALVRTWRRANPRIVKLWAVMQDAFDAGGRVGPHITVERHGGTIRMNLPSGRAITYHNVVWKRYVVLDPKTKKRIFKEGWTYSDPKKGGNTIGTYGGSLVENATQAIARDILAEALVGLERAGHRVVGHVHDEVIAEGTELADIERIMTDVPLWATGLPIDGEGFVCDRYRKG